MDTKAPTKYRISTVMTVILVFFAVCADLIGLIPFAKDVTATLFWGVTSIYFYTQGMGLFSGKKLAVMSVSWVVSLIPVLQEIPAEVTAGILAIIFITRVEDKTGISVVKPMTKGITPPRLNRNPFNGQPGIRPPRQKKKDNNVKNEADFPLDAGEMA